MENTRSIIEKLNTYEINKGKIVKRDGKYLTGKLYKAVYEAILIEKRECFKNCMTEFKKVAKSEKLKKWFQEEENGEKV
jgi:hypothetical protein